MGWMKGMVSEWMCGEGVDEDMGEKLSDRLAENG